ncbi:winged helix-turn-helix transcriptional regulator, partial [Bacillus amyloliquefaciens]|uniref:winged helix-turn-helix transcriptional regulator n=2 Tax=Bacillales TaxID=1385 RepID=UPI0037CEC647
EVYKQVPPKVEYSLTEFGRTLIPIITAMRDWGEAYKKMGVPSSVSTADEKD